VFEKRWVAAKGGGGEGGSVEAVRRQIIGVELNWYLDADQRAFWKRENTGKNNELHSSSFNQVRRVFGMG
jgi:hypothetical protein